MASQDLSPSTGAGSALPEFTPGPWTVDEDFTVWSGGLGIKSAPGEHVAHTTRGFEGPNGEGFANAHLISAAPDLYEALRRILPALEAEAALDGRGVARCWVPGRALIEPARAALAKAEGRSAPRSPEAAQVDTTPLGQPR